MKATCARERMCSRTTGRRSGPAGARASAGAVLAILLLAAGSVRANITAVTGNFHGNPVQVTKSPCPAHNTSACWSKLAPTDVTLLLSPTSWFQTTLAGEYPGAVWNFHDVGGNSNMNGTFKVDYYGAYNDCPGRLGATIQVSFVPDPGGSLIDDVLWIQTYRELWAGHDASAVDDRNAGTQPGAIPGPFYPYQDEDEDPPRWQSGYQYDQFYDKPGDPCPKPGTTTVLHFETYAAWWDDYFNADGSITDVGGDGHHVFIHEGFSWGYELYCVPAPASLLLTLLGVGAVTAWRRARMMV